MEDVFKLLNFPSEDTWKAEELFTKMDKNADGTVDQQEFIDACLNNQTLMHSFRFNT